MRTVALSPVILMPGTPPPQHSNIRDTPLIRGGMEFRRSQQMSSEEDTMVRSSRMRTVALSPVILMPGTPPPQHLSDRAHPIRDAPLIRAGMEFRRSQQMSSEEDTLSFPSNGDNPYSAGKLWAWETLEGMHHGVVAALLPFGLGNQTSFATDSTQLGG